MSDPPLIFITTCNGFRYQIDFEPTLMSWDPSSGYNEDYILRELTRLINYPDQRYNLMLQTEEGGVIPLRAVALIEVEPASRFERE